MIGLPGAAPLVLLPGMLCDERVFAPLLAGLGAREAQVETLDGAADVPALARRILAAAPPRFALLGFSLGGIVALELAAQARERVLGVALIGANARPIDRTERAARQAEARAGAARFEAHLGDALWPSYVAAGNDRAELQSAIFAMAMAAGADGLVAQTELGLGRRDNRAALARLERPVLVLAGAEDRRCPPVMQHELVDALPGAVLALVPGAGHFVLLEQPAATADHVSRWLARVDAAAETDAPTPALTAR